MRISSLGVESTIDISFIVPLFNHLAETRAMLASLQASISDGLSHEIILIDDNSTDGTREWLATLSDPVIRIVLNECNRGYAVTNNLAARMARGRVLALLNNDVLLSPEWLKPMMAICDDVLLKTGLVGNVQLRVADGIMDHAGVAVTPRGKIEHLRELPTGRAYKECFAVTGACCLVSREDFLAVGGFDEEFINGGEDVDLCLKLRHRGKRVYLACESVIRHHVSLSRDRQNECNERNSRRLFMKWRTEIKREMVQACLDALRRQNESFVDGVLTDGALATPHALASMLAEQALHEEEAYWQRMLDNVKPNEGLLSRSRVTGIRYCLLENGFLLDGVAELRLSQIGFVRNIFVCGRRCGDMDDPVALVLNVNGLHEKAVVLDNERNFNIGMIRPLLLPLYENRVSIAAFRINFQGRRLGDASDRLAFSHFVIDDQIIELG